MKLVGEVLGRYARRAGEVAARYGGEEFAVLLPHVDEDEAHALAQRLCQEIRDLNIPHASSLAAAHVTWRAYRLVERRLAMRRLPTTTIRPRPRARARLASSGWPTRRSMPPRLPDAIRSRQRAGQIGQPPDCE
jgi:hypothetical protein